MATVKAYIPIEYIGEKRAMGDSKSITRGHGTWIFCEKNNWTVKCPSDVADELASYPKLFIVHWDDGDKVVEMAAEIKLIKEQLKEKKKSPSNTKKE